MSGLGHPYGPDARGNITLGGRMRRAALSELHTAARSDGLTYDGRVWWQELFPDDDPRTPADPQLRAIVDVCHRHGLAYLREIRTPAPFGQTRIVTAAWWRPGMATAAAGFGGAPDPDAFVPKVEVVPTVSPDPEDVRG